MHILVHDYTVQVLYTLYMYMYMHVHQGRIEEEGACNCNNAFIDGIVPIVTKNRYPCTHMEVRRWGGVVTRVCRRQILSQLREWCVYGDEKVSLS